MNDIDLLDKAPAISAGLQIAEWNQQKYPCKGESQATDRSVRAWMVGCAQWLVQSREGVMIPHYVLLIHGMGEEKRGFNRGLTRNIHKEFVAAIAALKQRVPGLPQDIGGTDCVTVNEVCWSDVTQEDQDKLWIRLFPKLRGKRIGWRELLTNPRAWIRRARYLATLRQFVLNYFGDPISYVPGGHQYVRIHDRISQRLAELHREMLLYQARERLPALVTVVAHSLGSVIASDLIYDMLHQRNGRSWPPQVRLANFFSLGSPLALYMLRDGMDQQEFARPIAMQDPDGLWINVYDPQDILGFPLKPLNGKKGSYDRAVHADLEINAGHWWNPWHWVVGMTPFSHLLYWTDDRVAEMIGRKAALDWVRVNCPKAEPDLKPQYETYKQDFAQA